MRRGGQLTGQPYGPMAMGRATACPGLPVGTALGSLLWPLWTCRSAAPGQAPQRLGVEPGRRNAYRRQESAQGSWARLKPHSRLRMGENLAAGSRRVQLGSW